MILIHRITPFFIGLALAVSFVLLHLGAVNPIILVLAALILIFITLARLQHFQYKTFDFWQFTMSLVLFVASSYILFLFFESITAKVSIAIVVSLVSYFYSEHLFMFVHVPALYKPYALEYVSLAMYVLSVFFMSAGLYGLILFVSAPFYLLSGFFFLFVLFLVYSMFWVSKIEHKRSVPYAVAGAVLLTEIFTVTSFLPTSVYTDAALLAIFVYVFLGVCRAHVLDKLSPNVLRRYIIFGGILLTFVAASARWV